MQATHLAFKITDWWFDKTITGNGRSVAGIALDMEEVEFDEFVKMPKPGSILPAIMGFTMNYKMVSDGMIILTFGTEDEYIITDNKHDYREVENFVRKSFLKSSFKFDELKREYGIVLSMPMISHAVLKQVSEAVMGCLLK